MDDVNGQCVEELEVIHKELNLVASQSLDSRNLGT